jgi:hypothetical protein
MPDEQGRQGVLAFFASRPLLSLGASVASIISVPLAIYLYFSGARSRDLKYYVNPATTTIVKSGQSSDIHVLFKNEPVSTDVSALQVAIWNAGKEPIHAENVLDPILLKTSVPILEASVRRISRETTHFSIDTSRQSQGVLGMSWKILEGDDGAVVQLIIAGTGSPVTLSGAIEGQRRISAMGDAMRKYALLGTMALSLLAVLMTTVMSRRGPLRYGLIAYLAPLALIMLSTLLVFLLLKQSTLPEIPVPFN